jgi:apolipoprotein N-acyltransferase
MRVDGRGVSTEAVRSGTHGWRWGLALASGLASAVAFPPWDLGWVAFVGWAPLLLSLRGVRGREAAGLGYAAGLTFYLATIWWVINTMTTYGRMPLALSLVALVLLCGVLAAYTAVFAWLLAAGRDRLALPEGLLPVAGAALWTALEFLRTYLFSGFPWALLGYTQYRQPTVRLLAAATGVYGISALVLFVNGAAAGMLACLCRQRSESQRRRTLVLHAVLVGVVAVGTITYAWWGWRDVTGGAAVRVGVLQGNIDQSVKWDRRYQSRTLETYERLARLVAAERPSLIVWPETALPFFLRREPELGSRVQALVAGVGIPMLIGSPDVGADGLLYNSAFFLGPDGAIRGRYDKRHLVPFGEYVPLQRVFFFLHKLVTGIGDFGRGRVATVFREDGYRFSVMICYEVIFPAEVREFTRAGAEFLANITNDAWFGASGAPYQHLAMAAMRAVESGSYLVRAANTGVSAVIAPTGAILAQTPLFVETGIVGTIRLRTGETAYARYGDVLAWGCTVFLVGYGVALLWSSMARPRAARRRAQQGGTDDSGSRTGA